MLTLSLAACITSLESQDLGFEPEGDPQAGLVSLGPDLWAIRLSEDKSLGAFEHAMPEARTAPYTLFVGEQRLGPGTRVYFDGLPMDYTVEVYGTFEAVVPGEEGSAVRDLEVRLFEKTANDTAHPTDLGYAEEARAQEIFFVSWVSDKVMPRLLWAGDLDGDDRLDLIVADWLSSSTGRRLYLSSIAEGADIVGTIPLVPDIEVRQASTE